MDFTVVIAFLCRQNSVAVRSCVDSHVVFIDLIFINGGIVTMNINCYVIFEYSIFFLPVSIALKYHKGISDFEFLNA